MSTAIVLSGGGARGAFEVGAVQRLYERGVRPDILCGTSVGSLNAAKLAEGEDPGNPARGLPGLVDVWLQLRRNEDMYLNEPWLDQNPEFRDMLGHGKLDADFNLGLGPEWGDLAALLNPVIFMLAGAVAGPELIPKIQKLVAAVGSAQSLFSLEPIRRKLYGDPAHQVARALDPALVRGWSEGDGNGRRHLRLAVVALESGALRYVTETGAVIERDGRPVKTSAACTSLTDAAEAVQEQLDQVAAELHQAAPSEKPALVAQARELRRELARLQKDLAACRAQQVDLQVSIEQGVLASSTMPAVFRPVPLGGETYVDGGVREILPLQAAADLGASDIYAISASPLTVPQEWRRWNIIDILRRSLVDIALTEISVSDHRIDGGGPDGPTVSVIAPTIDAPYQATDVIPGLIRIYMDYGYLRAVDVEVAAGGGDAARARELSDAITSRRVAAWQAEQTALATTDGNAGRDQLQRAALLKVELRGLLDERRRHGWAVPAGADRWVTHWEWHESRPDTPFDVALEPFGYLDIAARVPGGVRVAGWAIDPDATGPVDVHVYVGAGMAGAATADLSRPDVAQAHPAYGDRHGFDFVVPAPLGTHRVAVYAINAGAAGTNPELGARDVAVSASPFGTLDAVGVSAARVRLQGWCIDPDTSGPLDVHVYVDGAFAGAGRADVGRPDVGQAHPGYGDAHGFDVTVPARPGARRVCVYAINAAGGDVNPEIGCRSVTVPLPAACQAIAGEIEGLQSELASLQDELRQAVGAEKAVIVAQIRRVNTAIGQARARLTACVEGSMNGNGLAPAATTKGVERV